MNLNSLLFITLFGALALAGCSSDTAGGAALGAAAGAAAAGGAYEYQNKQAVEQLEEDYQEGRIDYNEYQRRKGEIEEKSLLY